MNPLQFRRKDKELYLSTHVKFSFVLQRIFIYPTLGNLDNSTHAKLKAPVFESLAIEILISLMKTYSGSSDKNGNWFCKFNYWYCFVLNYDFVSIFR